MASPIKNNNLGGKRPGQKYKSLLVWQYLLKNTDENHAVKSDEIIEFLAQYGISADRHSISRDIKELQSLSQRSLDADMEERDSFNYEVIYDAHDKGYKVVSRPYDFMELRLLAECVRSSKFISTSQEKHLLDTIEGLCSSYQIDELKNEAYTVGRSKSSNKHLMAAMLKINQAIRSNSQIQFKYMKYTLDDRSTQVERRNGTPYIVSPFKMMINNGNYYLLAYNKKRGKIITYRLDRMKGVVITAEEREGQALYNELDMHAYTQRVFSMFSGEEKFVSIRFTNDLLDTAVEQFGNGSEVFYRVDDKGHFVVSAPVSVSNQFYSWVCGFYKKATITNPPEVVEGMKTFLRTISQRYEIE